MWYHRLHLCLLAMRVIIGWINADILLRLEYEKVGNDVGLENILYFLLMILKLYFW